MKQALLLFSFFISTTAMAQTAKYDTLRDSKNGMLVMKGTLTAGSLLNEPSYTWMQSSLEDFNPNLAVVERLRNTIKDYKLVLFLGTWCSDSHELVPKFLRLLDICHFPQGQLTIYGADRDKETGTGLEKKYKVSLLPTIIVLQNNKEVGRITETVSRSVEDDLLDIILGKKKK